MARINGDTENPSPDYTPPAKSSGSANGRKVSPRTNLTETQAKTAGAGQKAIDQSRSGSPSSSRSQPSRAPSPDFPHDVKQLTPKELKQLRDQGERWVVGGYILAAIAIIGIAASIGLGVHTHQLFLGVAPAVGFSVIGMAAYGVQSRGKEKIYEGTPPHLRTKRTTPQNANVLRTATRGERST